MEVIKRITILILFLLTSFYLKSQPLKYAVLVSANMEWKAIKELYPDKEYFTSPWGTYFYDSIASQNILFFHEGWGKVAAAGATQYVIDTFDPEILINLGTCGGFKGGVKRYDIILCNKTIIYDIKEAMGDSKEAIMDYSTAIDISWLKGFYPVNVIDTLLVSGDRDLIVEEIDFLKKEYGAIAGDWETGAIAYTASRNQKKLLILRGVSDLVSPIKDSETYGNFDVFVKRAKVVMEKLITDLPKWIHYIESL